MVCPFREGRRREKAQTAIWKKSSRKREKRSRRTWTEKTVEAIKKSPPPKKSIGQTVFVDWLRNKF